MAAGDIKGDEAVVVVLTAGAAVTKGQVVHYESDGYYDPVAELDYGPFAVAIDAAAAAAATFRAVIWGRVEVALEGTGNALIGSPLKVGLTTTNGSPLGTVCLSTDPSGNVCGIATEAADTSGNLLTMWVGLGGT